MKEQHRRACFDQQEVGSMVTSTLYCDKCGAANQQQAKLCFACGTSLPDDSAPLGKLSPNHVLKQRYRICSLMGQGGMGAVYKAEDMQFGNRFMAVKEMRLTALNLDEANQAIAAFQDEALLLAGLMHPNMPRIYDHFSEDGHWYLLMDFIDGPTLEEYLLNSQYGYLPLEEVIDIGIQLCTALDYLHTRQPPIIFRDLKPANIIRTDNGQLSLIDFGIARHFKPGQLKDTIPFGSVGYAAPEQYGRVQTSPRADIYSLGATLHHLLSGHSPTLNPFRFALLQSHGQAVPAELEALIMQMVALDENNRPASVSTISQELQWIAARNTSTQLGIIPLEFNAGLPFAAQQFDLLICGLILCHVTNLTQAIREFARVLQPGGHLLITDFHPDSVHYGWRTGFRQADARYLLPNMLHTRNDYLETLTPNGLTLLKVLDLPLRALPPRPYRPPLTEEFIQLHGEMLFCLLLLAQKA